MVWGELNTHYITLFSLSHLKMLINYGYDFTCVVHSSFAVVSDISTLHGIKQFVRIRKEREWTTTMEQRIDFEWWLGEANGGGRSSTGGRLQLNVYESLSVFMFLIRSNKKMKSLWGRKMGKRIDLTFGSLSSATKLYDFQFLRLWLWRLSYSLNSVAGGGRSTGHVAIIMNANLLTKRRSSAWWLGRRSRQEKEI